MGVMNFLMIVGLLALCALAFYLGYLVHSAFIR